MLGPENEEMKHLNCVDICRFLLLLNEVLEREFFSRFQLVDAYFMYQSQTPAQTCKRKSRLAPTKKKTTRNKILFWCRTVLELTQSQFDAERV